MPDDPNIGAWPLPNPPGSGEVRELDPLPSVVEALEHVPPRRDNSRASDEADAMSADPRDIQIGHLRRVVLRLVMQSNECPTLCTADPNWPIGDPCGCMVQADTEMLSDG